MLGRNIWNWNINVILTWQENIWNWNICHTDGAEYMENNKYFILTAKYMEKEHMRYTDVAESGGDVAPSPRPLDGVHPWL